MSESQVLLVAGTHGNEVNASWLFDQWENFPELIGTRGLDVFRVIGNPYAREVGKRYINSDLNRCFSPSLLNSPVVRQNSTRLSLGSFVYMERHQL